jgi:hypothetical protein
VRDGRGDFGAEITDGKSLVVNAVSIQQLRCGARCIGEQYFRPGAEQSSVRFRDHFWPGDI